MKRRYIEARKTLDGVWKVKSMNDRAFPGVIDSWPELDKLTAVLTDLGYDVAHVAEPDQYARSITLLRPDPEDEDYKIYKALGYSAGTVTADDDVADAAADLTRRLF